MHAPAFPCKPRSPVRALYCLCMHPAYAHSLAWSFRHRCFTMKAMKAIKPKTHFAFACTHSVSRGSPWPVDIERFPVLHREQEILRCLQGSIDYRMPITCREREVPRHLQRSSNVLLPCRERSSIRCFHGAPGRTRTCNLRIRSPLLYPVELRAQGPSSWGAWPIDADTGLQVRQASASGPAAPGGGTA